MHRFFLSSFPRKNSHRCFQIWRMRRRKHCFRLAVVFRRLSFWSAQTNRWFRSGGAIAAHRFAIHHLPYHFLQRISALKVHQLQRFGAQGTHTADKIRDGGSRMHSHQLCQHEILCRFAAFLPHTVKNAHHFHHHHFQFLLAKEFHIQEVRQKQEARNKKRE